MRKHKSNPIIDGLKSEQKPEPERLSIFLPTGVEVCSKTEGTWSHQYVRQIVHLTREEVYLLHDQLFRILTKP